MDNEVQVLQQARPLQVHRKTDYSPMNDQLATIFSELAQLRERENRQIRKEVRLKKHLDVIILDLWVAAKYSNNPWRRISLNRNDFTKETRYRKIFLKYDLFRGTLFDLISLGYVDYIEGFFDRENNIGYQSRIKASDKLLSLLKFDINKIGRDPEAPEEEIIIKNDEDGKRIDYKDDRFTNQMREELTTYNEWLRQTNINTDAIDLRYKHDPTSITVKRIFKDEKGGRFYGGFWENMPKDDRAKLQLDGHEVCELDFSAMHPTIAYAQQGIALKEDPYLFDGCERNEVKKAFLVLFNCKSREQAINTVRSLGIKNVKELIASIELKHADISKLFYKPEYGMQLQNHDAWVAEKVLKRMSDKGIVVLSVHDSFITSKEHETTLRTVMSEVFYEVFSFKPIIK